jgi:hypothetical protein
MLTLHEDQTKMAAVAVIMALLMYKVEPPSGKPWVQVLLGEADEREIYSEPLSDRIVPGLASLTQLAVWVGRLLHAAAGAVRPLQVR